MNFFCLRVLLLPLERQLVMLMNWLLVDKGISALSDLKHVIWSLYWRTIWLYVLQFSFNWARSIGIYLTLLKAWEGTLLVASSLVSIYKVLNFWALLGLLRCFKRSVFSCWAISTFLLTFIVFPIDVGFFVRKSLILALPLFRFFVCSLFLTSFFNSSITMIPVTSRFLYYGLLLASQTFSFCSIFRPLSPREPLLELKKVNVYGSGSSYLPFCGKTL